MTQVKRSVKNLPKQQRVIGGVIIGIFVVVIAAAAMTLISRFGKVAVEVKVAPFDAVVYLNGERVANDGLNYLLPGTYDLTAEREHFEPMSETVTVSEDNKYILGKLMAGDEEGERITSERLNDYLAVEAVMGELAMEEGAAIKEKWPILQYLPINNNFYSISYAYDDAGEPTIKVKAGLEYIDIAVQKMRVMKNIELTDYRINFEVENNFKSFVVNDAVSVEEFIRDGFGSVMRGKSFGEGRTMGDYYVTTIYTEDYARDTEYGHFRVVVKKSGGNWELAATPQPLLTSDNAPGVPKDVLKVANSL